MNLLSVMVRNIYFLIGLDNLLGYKFSSLFANIRLQKDNSMTKILMTDLQKDKLNPEHIGIVNEPSPLCLFNYVGENPVFSLL